MMLIADLHPVIVHFPIALVLVASAAECLAIATGRRHWRWLAAVNLRTGAAFALAAAMAGWRLASAAGAEPTPLLEWHRWLGVMAAVAATGAAAATFRIERSSRRYVWVYRGAVFAAAAAVAAAGHLGGLMVWGR
jgi:uncharacterized membrane protein